MAFSEDGQKILSGSHDGKIKIWNVRTVQLLQTLMTGTRTVLSAVFYNDGQNLVSGSLKKPIQIWDVGAGQLLQTLKGHTGTVRSVALSRDGKRLLVRMKREQLRFGGRSRHSVL